ncbi:MAG: endonuclease III domain-containing protein [Syntrophomonadaceae bacterium]|jgi:endonuclease-3 related protein
MMNTRVLMEIYHALLNHFGHRNWWPGDTRMEIMLGAILTQAVSWKNVERAIANIKERDLLDLAKLKTVDQEELAELIKPALYHRQKARKIKELINFIVTNYEGNLDSMFKEPLGTLRDQLLQVWGIGPETADSILLYAGGKRVFVVDAYTRRVFYRLGLVEEDITYAELQQLMETHLPPQIEIYNDYHAQIVALGASYCKKNKPLCNKCPIAAWCEKLPDSRRNHDGGRKNELLE